MPVIGTRLDTADPQAPVVVVSARNAADEPLVGLAVELNLDREESAALTEAGGGGPLELVPETGFEQGVVITGATGEGRGVLRIGAGQGPGLLVLAIDAAGRTETLIYEVPK